MTRSLLMMAALAALTAPALAEVTASDNASNYALGPFTTFDQGFGWENAVVTRSDESSATEFDVIVAAAEDFGGSSLLDTDDKSFIFNVRGGNAGPDFPANPSASVDRNLGGSVSFGNVEEFRLYFQHVGTTAGPAYIRSRSAALQFQLSFGGTNPVRTNPGNVTYTQINSRNPIALYLVNNTITGQMTLQMTDLVTNNVETETFTPFTAGNLGRFEWNASAFGTIPSSVNTLIFNRMEFSTTPGTLPVELDGFFVE